MKEAGGLLMSIGALALIGAFFVDVSVDVGYIPASPYLPSMPREVANLHAMHIQTLIVHGGLAAFIAGMIAYGFGTVDETLRRNSAPPPTPAGQTEPSETPAADQPGDTGDNATLQVVGIIVVIAVIFLIIVAYAENSGGGSSPDYNDTAMDANEALMNAEDALNQAEADLANASR